MPLMRARASHPFIGLSKDHQARCIGIDTMHRELCRQSQRLKERWGPVAHHQLVFTHFEPGFAEDRGRYTKVRSPAVERLIDVRHFPCFVPEEQCDDSGMHMRLL